MSAQVLRERVFRVKVFRDFSWLKFVPHQDVLSVRKMAGSPLLVGHPNHSVGRVSKPHAFHEKPVNKWKRQIQLPV